MQLDKSSSVIFRKYHSLYIKDGMMDRWVWEVTHKPAFFLTTIRGSSSAFKKSNCISVYKKNTLPTSHLIYDLSKLFHRFDVFCYNVMFCEKVFAFSDFYIFWLFEYFRWN